MPIRISQGAEILRHFRPPVTSKPNSKVSFEYPLFGTPERHHFAPLVKKHLWANLKAYVVDTIPKIPAGGALPQKRNAEV